MVLSTRFRYSDADRNGNIATGSLERSAGSRPGAPFDGNAAAIGTARRLPAIPAAHPEPGRCNGLAQEFQVFHGISGRLTRKDDRKLLSSATIGFSSAGHLGQAGGHHAQHLVADVVAKSVIESLEMVHIHNRNRIVFP